VALSAVGIDGDGVMHPLGALEGATENAAVVQALLDNLIERGLDPKVCRLLIIDGAKALRQAWELDDATQAEQLTRTGASAGAGGAGCIGHHPGGDERAADGGSPQAAAATSPFFRLNFPCRKPQPVDPAR